MPLKSDTAYSLDPASCKPELTITPTLILKVVPNQEGVGF